MSEEDNKFNLEDIPDVPGLRDLIESGYGKVIINDHGPDRPKTGFHLLSFGEMEAMGPEERERLGVEKMYQFALAHKDEQ